MAHMVFNIRMSKMFPSVVAAPCVAPSTKKETS